MVFISLHYKRKNKWLFSEIETQFVRSIKITLKLVNGTIICFPGMYTCGEIVPIKGVNYYHIQTAVLCVISRKKKI